MRRKAGRGLRSLFLLFSSLVRFPSLGRAGKGGVQGKPTGHAETDRGRSFEVGLNARRHSIHGLDVENKNKREVMRLRCPELEP